MKYATPGLVHVLNLAKFGDMANFSLLAEN